MIISIWNILQFYDLDRIFDTFKVYFNYYIRIAQFLY